MPVGVFDIRDRCPVLHPSEIAAGKAQCEAQDLQYIEQPGGGAIPLTTYLEAMTNRWRRAQQTAQMIEAIRAGYCSVLAKEAPLSSDARH